LKKLNFLLGTNLSSLTGALGSISLLSIRVNSLVTNLMIGTDPGAIGEIAALKPGNVTLFTVFFYNTFFSIRKTTFAI